MPYLPCNLGQVSCLSATSPPPLLGRWVVGGSCMEDAKIRVSATSASVLIMGAQVLSSVGLSGEPGPDPSRLCPPTALCMGAVGHICFPPSHDLLDPGFSRCRLCSLGVAWKVISNGHTWAHPRLRIAFYQDHRCLVCPPQLEKRQLSLQGSVALTCEPRIRAVITGAPELGLRLT